MKQTYKSIPMTDTPYIRQYFKESCGFFDIETTGFSPKNSFIYLIGLAIRQKNTIHIYQFLAENRKEESDIIAAFYKKVSFLQTLITFNGLGFDIPFLKSRGAFHSISENLDSFEYIDLYKLTGKFAHLFQLENKKQKTIEKFLGIFRKDTYTGGELISIYYDYEKHPTSESEQLLLLHNYEDVLGMTELLSLLSYRDFLEHPIHVLNVQIQNYRPYHSDIEQQELILNLDVSTAFPKDFLYRTNYCSLMCQNTSAKLLIPVFFGDLKFYYENPKDYYYLPEEDMAIHKSVAAFVDSSHKKKATATTCYTKKKGLFLPQLETLFTPCFYPEKKSRLSYFEMTEQFLADTSSQNLYASHLLSLCQ